MEALRRSEEQPYRHSGYMFRECIAEALTAYGEQVAEQVREEERERHQSTPLLDPTRFGISDDPRRRETKQR